MIFPDIHGNGNLHLSILKEICGDLSGKSMIDLMCHRAPHTPRLGFSSSVYIDIQDRDFDFPEVRKDFILIDVLKFNSLTNFDFSFCLDGIEHLSKDDGHRLLNLMTEISTNQVIFTPLGYVYISAEKDPDSHKTGWTPDELPDWNKIIFPDWHPTLEVGAWYAWKGKTVDEETIKTIINDTRTNS